MCTGHLEDSQSVTKERKNLDKDNVKCKNHQAISKSKDPFTPLKSRSRLCKIKTNLHGISFAPLLMLFSLFCSLLCHITCIRCSTELDENIVYYICVSMFYMKTYFFIQAFSMNSGILYEDIFDLFCMGT